MIAAGCKRCLCAPSAVAEAPPRIAHIAVGAGLAHREISGRIRTTNRYRGVFRAAACLASNRARIDFASDIRDGTRRYSGHQNQT